MAMDLKHFFYTVIFALTFTTATAQAEIPAGYTKGSITLADASVLTGFIKDNLKKAAAVSFIDNAGKKRTYQGIEINGASIDGTNYICLKGDFFKAITVGKLNFLQKASDASNSASFNGSEASFNGTEGKIGDYFVYNNKELKLLNKRTIASFIDTDLNGCTAAIEKAKSANGDIAKLQEAVEIYNRSK